MWRGWGEKKRMVCNRRLNLKGTMCLESVQHIPQGWYCAMIATGRIQLLPWKDHLGEFHWLMGWSMGQVMKVPSPRMSCSPRVFSKSFLEKSYTKKDWKYDWNMWTKVWLSKSSHYVPFPFKSVLTIPCKHVVYAGLTMKVQGRPVPQTVW